MAGAIGGGVDLFRLLTHQSEIPGDRISKSPQWLVGYLQRSRARKPDLGETFLYPECEALHHPSLTAVEVMSYDSLYTDLSDPGYCGRHRLMIMGAPTPSLYRPVFGHGR